MSMAETKRITRCQCGEVEMELVGAPLASLHVSFARQRKVLSRAKNIIFREFTTWKLFVSASWRRIPTATQRVA